MGIGGGGLLARLFDILEAVGDVGETSPPPPPKKICCFGPGDRGELGSTGGGPGGGGGGALEAGVGSPRGVARGSCMGCSDNSSSDSDPALGDFTPAIGGIGGRAVPSISELAPESIVAN